MNKENVTNKEVKQNCEEKLTKVYLNLLKSEPFFANFSYLVEKKISYEIPTAAAGFNSQKEQLTIYINPDYFASLSEKQAIGLIVHEFYHIIFKHIQTRINDETDRKIWNIATDLAINCLIADHYELPPNGLMPGIGLFKNFEKYDFSENYYKKVMADSALKEKCLSMIPMDSHNLWKNLSEREKNCLENSISKALNKSTEKALKMGWGSISSIMEEYIKNCVSPQINWNSQLRYFIKKSKKSDKKSSIRIINKRYPRIHAGKKITRHANIAFSIDESGSVENELFAKIWLELESYSKIATFTVIPFDSEVFEDEIFEWKKGKQVPPRRVLCGGTNFNAPTDYVNKHNFDGHIICTDLLAPVPGISKCPRIWLTSAKSLKENCFEISEQILSII